MSFPIFRQSLPQPTGAAGNPLRPAGASVTNRSLAGCNTGHQRARARTHRSHGYRWVRSGVYEADAVGGPAQAEAALAQAEAALKSCGAEKPRHGGGGSSGSGPVAAAPEAAAKR